MTATTAAIIAAGAASSAAQSAQRAARAAECSPILMQYDAKAAGVSEMRSYAACVRDVYGTGEPMDPGALLGLKLAISVCVIGFLIGVVLGFSQDGFDGAFIMGLMGLCAGMLIATIGLGIAFVVLA